MHHRNQQLQLPSSQLSKHFGVKSTDEKNIEIPMLGLSQQLPIEFSSSSYESLIQLLTSELKSFYEFINIQQGIKQKLLQEKTENTKILDKINADSELFNQKLKNIHERMCAIEDNQIRNKNLLRFLKSEKHSLSMINDDKRIHYANDMWQTAEAFDKDKNNEIKNLNSEAITINEILKEYEISSNEISATNIVISNSINLTEQNIELHQNKINETFQNLHSINFMYLLSTQQPATPDISILDASSKITSTDILPKDSEQEIMRSKKSKIKKRIKINAEEISRRIKAGEIKEGETIIKINPPTIAQTETGETLTATQGGKDNEEEYVHTAGRKTGHFSDRAYSLFRGPTDEAFDLGLKIYKNKSGYLFLHININHQDYMLRIILNSRQQNKAREKAKNQREKSLPEKSIIKKTKPKQKKKMSQEISRLPITLTQDAILKQIKEHEPHVIEVDPKEVGIIYMRTEKKIINGEYCFRGKPTNELIEGEYALYVKPDIKGRYCHDYIYIQTENKHYMLNIASTLTEKRRQAKEKRLYMDSVIEENNPTAKISEIDARNLDDSYDADPSDSLKFNWDLIFPLNSQNSPESEESKKIKTNKKKRTRWIKPGEIDEEEISRRIKAGEIKEGKAIIKINSPEIIHTKDKTTLKATQVDEKGKQKEIEYVYSGKKTGKFARTKYCFFEDQNNESFVHDLKIYQGPYRCSFLHVKVGKDDYMMQITLKRHKNERLNITKPKTLNKKTKKTFQNQSKTKKLKTGSPLSNSMFGLFNSSLSHSDIPINSDTPCNSPNVVLRSDSNSIDSLTLPSNEQIEPALTELQFPPPVPMPDTLPINFEPSHDHGYLPSLRSR